MPDKTFATEQEAFWAGEFGVEYTARQDRDAWIAANIEFFHRALTKAPDVASIMELGCNAGLNLSALSQIKPVLALSAVEINETAAEVARSQTQAAITIGSILDPLDGDGLYDLTFTKGVLIHINPDQLEKVYDNLFRLSRRYVLVAEYYNPSPVEITYRGHSGRLFKRDFAGELMDRHGLKLVDYGFAWHRDPACAQDDLTWFLLEKSI